MRQALTHEQRVAGAREATYADVYALDPAWGSRDEDAALWASLCYDRNVVEVGCGNGRVPMLLDRHECPRHRWVGIDADPGMVEQFNRDVSGEHVGFVGDASERDVWKQVAAHGPFDVAIVPFSTLYLIEHDRQADVLRHAAGVVRPGGLVAAEVFLPQLQFMSSGRSSSVGGCRQPDGYTPSGWVRLSLFDVDAAARTTRVTRYYGNPSAYEMCVRECLYWREPTSLVQLGNEAGLVDVDVLTHDRAANIPRGHVVLFGRT